MFLNTPYVSKYVEFELYDYCWYWYSPQAFPHEKNHLVRWLGVAQISIQAMVYYVISDNGYVLGRSNVPPLDPSDYDVKKHRLDSKTWII